MQKTPVPASGRCMLWVFEALNMAMRASRRIAVSQNFKGDGHQLLRLVSAHWKQEMRQAQQSTLGVSQAD